MGKLKQLHIDCSPDECRVGNKNCPAKQRNNVANQYKKRMEKAQEMIWTRTVDKLEEFINEIDNIVVHHTDDEIVEKLDQLVSFTAAAIADNAIKSFSEVLRNEFRTE